MTYKKPSDITYTEMCIYIDNHIYEKEFDTDLIFEYLYHISCMLARKANYFTKASYLDGFGLFMASKLYFRLTNEKQFELNEDGTPKLEKIKSVLNFAKAILYPIKVDYEQSEYYQGISKNTYEEALPEYNFENILNKSINQLLFCEYSLLFSDIGKTCKAFLRTLPYKENSVEWKNIYLSVLLTFLDQVTFDKKAEKRFNHFIQANKFRDDKVIKMYENLSTNKAKLFHLDPSMNDYIIVLTRQLKNIIKKDLMDILHTNTFNNLTLTKHSVDDFIKDFEVNDEY